MVAGSRPVLVIAWEWHIGLALFCGCSEALEYPTTNSCGPINKSLSLLRLIKINTRCVGLSRDFMEMSIRDVSLLKPHAPAIIYNKTLNFGIPHVILLCLMPDLILSCCSNSVLEQLTNVVDVSYATRALREGRPLPRQLITPISRSSPNRLFEHLLCCVSDHMKPLSRCDADKLFIDVDTRSSSPWLYLYICITSSDHSNTNISHVRWRNYYMMQPQWCTDNGIWSCFY